MLPRVFLLLVKIFSIIKSNMQGSVVVVWDLTDTNGSIRASDISTKARQIPPVLNK